MDHTAMTIMRPGRGDEIRVVDLAAEPGYDRLRALIETLLDGQPLEHVSVLHDGRRTDMFVDECGSLNGLPRNDTATAIYRCNWLTQHPDQDPESLPAIYGTAILFSRLVWF